MELSTQVVTRGTKRAEEIVLTHRGYQLNWQPIERTSIEEGLDVFEQINGYWNSTPLTWQDQVFEIYTTLHQIMNEGNEIDDLSRALRKPITQLLDLHDLSKIRDWIDLKSFMGIPSGVAETYDESASSRWSREKTYTVEDYRQFVTLSVALRPMLPVWGEFIFLTKREYKNWKEYYAYQLISQAKLMESPAMIRLQNYINSMLPDDEELQPAILLGLSTIDFPEWITAVTVIRRLAIADIRGLPDKPNAISFIFLYLSNRTKSWNNNLMGVVQKKRNPENFNPDAESKLSQLEEYKVKQLTPAGDLTAIEHPLYDPQRLALQICPDLDLTLLAESLESVAQMDDFVLHVPQRTLIQYVMKKRVSPRAFVEMQRAPVMAGLAITQAILWHRGYYHLAALVSAYEQKNLGAYQAGMTINPPKIPKDYTEQLDTQFPYHSRISNRHRAQKERNRTILAIEAIAEEFRKNPWVLSLPSQWLPRVISNPHDRKYALPLDLKVMLSQLILTLATRSF